MAKQMAPDDNCLIAVVLTLLLFVVTMRELEWNMAYFLPTVAAIVYYAVSTHRDWTSQGMLSDSLDSRPETHANDIIMSADPHFRSPGQKAYLGWFFTKPGGTSTTGTPSAQRKGLHTVTSGSSKHFSIGAHPSPSTYFGNSEAQSSRNTPRSLSSAGWNRSSSLARSSNADSMNNSQPAESSNADSLDSSQPAESVVSLSPGSYQSNSAPASTGSGSPAGSSGSVRPASSLEIATPDAVAHAKSKDSSRSTAYKKPKRNQSKRKAYRAQQANQAAAAMVQAAAAAALPYYSEDTSDSTRSVRASDGAKSVDASDSASSTAASGFTKEPKPMQQFKGAAKTQISSKASLASSVDTVDATSFKGILEAFVRRVASYDKYHQQAAIDAVTKLYTTASLGVFTAYSLYPRAATATNGFALLLEVLSNKQNMTVEEQVFVCTESWVYMSIELFLWALIADQFIRQKRTLLPLLIAELPSKSRNLSMGGIVQQYVLPSDIPTTTPAVVTKTSLKILAELLQVRG